MKEISANNRKKKVSAALALTVMLAGNTWGPALAQGMDIGSAQDSLLPPEVVPLDPAAASRMAQAQTRAASASNAASAMGGLGDQMGGMQTAQQARQTAFDALMNQSQAQPLNQSYQAAGGQAGNMSGFGPAPMQGQPMANNGSVSQSAWVQPSQNGGSQTLTGGVAYQPVKQDIRRSGMSNAVSAVAGIGTGLLLGSLVSRSMYSSPLGLGFMGLGLTGFGLRNGFRW